MPRKEFDRWLCTDREYENFLERCTEFEKETLRKLLNPVALL
jgi:hypothetical protein